VEDMGAGISDNKVVVTSLVMLYPSWSGGVPGFFLFVELRRSKHDSRGEVSGGLVNKLDGLYFQRLWWSC
jgi:hypothetical protein